MIDLMLANAAAGDPASIRALTLLQVLGFDEERLHNTFQDHAEPVPERELEVWEILDIHVNAMKQRKRDYWLQKYH